MKKRGEIAKAREFVASHRADLRLEPLARNFESRMRELNKRADSVRASSMSPPEKRAALDRIDDARNRVSENVASRFRELSAAE